MDRLDRRYPAPFRPTYGAAFHPESGRRTEIEFLDIHLTKDSSLVLHAIHSPWRILKKTLPVLVSGFENPYKKSAKQENSSLFILLNGKMWVENQTKAQV